MFCDVKKFSILRMFVTVMLSINRIEWNFSLNSMMYYLELPWLCLPVNVIICLFCHVRRHVLLFCHKCNPDCSNICATFHQKAKTNITIQRFILFILLKYKFNKYSSHVKCNFKHEIQKCRNYFSTQCIYRKV